MARANMLELIDAFTNDLIRDPVPGLGLLGLGLGTYLVLGAQPILGCISRFHGRFTGTCRDIISEIVNLGDHLCRSGYCPVLGRLLVPYITARMSAGG